MYHRYLNYSFFNQFQGAPKQSAPGSRGTNLPPSKSGTEYTCMYTYSSGMVSTFQRSRPRDVKTSRLYVRMIWITNFINISEIFYFSAEAPHTILRRQENEKRNHR